LTNPRWGSHNHHFIPPSPKSGRHHGPKSHATAWPSADPAVAVLQAEARQWLDEIAPKYRLVTSQFVLDEASLGDPTAASLRLELLAKIAILIPNQRVETIADEIVTRSLIRQRRGWMRYTWPRLRLLVYNIY
jgi:hypothetical protein